MLRSVIMVLAACAVSAAAQDTQPGAKPQETKDVPKPAATAVTAGEVRVKLETTLGDIVLALDADKAPISVDNFVKYVDAGQYDGTVFHRVMRNFMIQGGGYTTAMDEKKDGLRPAIKNEWRNGLKNKRGTIAMARTGAPDSATAQFFINVVDNDRLDQPVSGGAAYAVFGRVVEGMDVVDKIRNTTVIQHPKYPSPDGPVTPQTAVVIKSAKVLGEVDRAKLAAAAQARVAESEKAAQEATAARDREIQEYIAKVEKETSIKPERTPSGIYSFILKPGEGASPKSTDNVKVHYTGTLLNGKKFDSSVDRGEPAVFPLNRVIPGWTEGVGLMKVGEKRKLVIPPNLAYGATPPPGANIPPNAWLAFDVELLEINPAK